MKNLSNSLIFKGMSENDITQLIKQLNTYKKIFKKNEFIYTAGDAVDSMGLVLQGKVNIQYVDVYGNISILNQVGPGGIFAETYAVVKNNGILVDVVADCESEILFINVERILSDLDSSTEVNIGFLKNLLRVTAQKNIDLSMRIFHTTSKTIRGRVISFLSFYAQKEGSLEFTIPFNRQQLAEYLNLDRSALSGELSKMKSDQLIDYQKNHFKIYKGIQ